jgi:site-specific DNA-methyltransferase (adenine-specific)
LGDKFRPSTSDMVIACTSDRRWFDLDAVRTPHVTADALTRPRATYKRSHEDDGESTNSGGNPAGAPPLDHWIIPPGGYSGSHYAVFPPALLEKPVEACCPRRVCRTCGTPSRRLTSEPEYVPSATNRGGVMVAEAERKGEGVNQWANEDGAQASVVRTSTTIGWTSCDCPGTDGIRLDGYHTGTGWRPGLVLDPFGGSGTTGLVASGRSRDCTLVDLDDRNADLARERLGMFLEVTHHNPEAAA